MAAERDAIMNVLSVLSEDEMTQETKQLLDICKKIRETIASGWTRGCMARDAERFSVPEKSSFAVCWCLSGAILKNAETIPIENKVFALVQKRLSGFRYISEWNDAPGRTQEQVLELIDSIILELQHELYPDD